MHIKSVIIENLFCFNNKTTLLLDLKNDEVIHEVKNHLIKTCSNDVFLPVVGITGPNASGKTSILKSIEFVFNYFNMTNNSFRINRLLKSIECLLSTEFKKTKNKLNSLLDVINKEYINIALCNIDNSSLKNSLNELYDYQLNNLILDNLTTLIQKDIEEEISDKNKLFNSFKKDQNKISYIKIHMCDEPHRDFIISICDNKRNLNSLLSLANIEFNNEKENINNNFFNDFESYCQGLASFIEIEPMNKNLLNKSLEKLIELLDLEMVSDILNEVDKKTKRIIFDRNRNIVKCIQLTDNSRINVNMLSCGTKKFIYYLSCILDMANKSNSSIVLCDNIDNNLDNELINFLKHYFYLTDDKKQFQLFFTSKNLEALTSIISNKQIFLINNEDGLKIEKAFNLKKDNFNLFKSLHEKRIGSYLNSNSITNLCIDIISYKKYK